MSQSPSPSSSPSPPPPRPFNEAEISALTALSQNLESRIDSLTEHIGHVKYRLERFRERSRDCFIVRGGVEVLREYLKNNENERFEQVVLRAELDNHGNDGVEEHWADEIAGDRIKELKKRRNMYRDHLAIVEEILNSEEWDLEQWEVETSAATNDYCTDSDGGEQARLEGYGGNSP